MDKRERLQATIEGQPVDRLAVALWRHFPVDDQRPEEISAPVAPGTVQLPPDGQPIVLLADAQTVGGYPRLGHVVAADLPRLAQLRPGDSLRFQACDLQTATRLACAARARIARISLMIERKLLEQPVTD